MVIEGGIVVGLGMMTMDTGGLHGGPHHRHRIEVVVITLRGGRHHHIEVVVLTHRQGGHHHHIEAAGVITLLGAHHITVGDRDGSEQGLLHHILLTGVLKGTMVVVR